MKFRSAVFAIFLLLAALPVLSYQASGIDLEGEESSVVVRAYIKIHDDGLLSLNFKVLWGASEFTGSDIFRPKAYPPTLPWADLDWDSLKEYITPIDTIEHLFNSTFSDGKKLTDTPEYFVKKALDIDTSFSIESVKPRILTEFMTIEIKVELMPGHNSYTIAPLRFLSKMDFGGFPPVGEVIIETASSIDIQPSSLAINHFLYPEGNRFKSEALYFENERITYDISEDSIRVRKLPFFLSATILYSLWIGAAILSMIMVAVASRRAKKRVNKGLEMWVGIGVVCFLAFIPYHLFLSYLFIVLGFAYSVRKSRMLTPEKEKEAEKEKKAKEGEEKEHEKEAEIPPPLPFSQTTIPVSDSSFAPSTKEENKSAP